MAIALGARKIYLWDIEMPKGQFGSSREERCKRKAPERSIGRRWFPQYPPRSATSFGTSHLGQRYQLQLGKNVQICSLSGSTGFHRYIAPAGDIKAIETERGFIYNVQSHDKNRRWFAPRPTCHHDDSAYGKVAKARYTRLVVSQWGYISLFRDSRTLTIRLCSLVTYYTLVWGRIPFWQCPTTPDWLNLSSEAFL